jgi:hypothetical protein
MRSKIYQVEDEEGEEETGKVTEREKDDKALGHAVERHDHHPWLTFQI